MAVYNVTFDSLQQDTKSPPNVIFIDDNPSVGDLLDMTLDWTVDAPNPLVLKDTGNTKASQTNYHFSLTFTTGLLAKPDSIAIAPESVDDGWDICVYDGRHGIVIYCLSKDELTLQPGDSCTVTLQNVGAASKWGNGRAASIPFSFNTKFVSDNVQPSDLSHLPFTVTIEKFTPEQGGLPYAPLAVNFDTTNMVLSDGTSQNVLVLRIANQGLTDIALDPAQTSFMLSFDADTDTTQRSALATPNQVNAFYIPGKLDSSGLDGGWTGFKAWYLDQHSDNPPTWKLSPWNTNTALKAGDSLEIPISNIVTGHPTGRALLHVQVQGLSGYSDQTFAVEIEKSPLFYGNGKVGIGTTKPYDPLKIFTGNKSTGWSHDDGTVNLLTYIDDGSGACLGTYSNHPLHFFTNDNVSAPQLTLTTDGKLGIGTTQPSATLDVQGDATISGKLGIGTTSPAHPLQVQTSSGTCGLSHTDGTVDPATCVDGQGGHLLTQSNHPLHFRTNSANNGTPQLTLATNGRVGIGTTVPGAPLQVFTGNKSRGFSHDDGVVEFITYVDDDTGAWLETATPHAIYLRTYGPGGGTPQITLQNDGNVGICTISPSERLHVNGNVRVDGAININGQSPMVVKSYGIDSGSNPNYYQTEWPTSEWIGCVVGYGNAGNGRAPVWLEADNSGDYVGITYDIGNNECTSVSLLLIRKEICAGPYSG